MATKVREEIRPQTQKAVEKCSRRTGKSSTKDNGRFCVQAKKVKSYQ